MKERLKLISENRIFLYFISFCTPIFLMLLVCLFSGFYPFGDKAYLIWDSDIQFVPFLAQFKAIVSSGTDFVYSFAKAGGNGMLDFNACYINNPLNFIAFLFPDNRLDVAFQAIVFVRIALTGLSFSYFLNHDKKFDYRTLMFSTAYALSSCAIYYSQSIMGFEAMYILPVAMVGIEKIVKEQKCLLFILSEAIAFLIEPYAGWVVMFFSLYYFLYSYFLNKPQNTKKVFALYLTSIAFIILLSAIVTLPVWFALQGTKTSSFYLIFTGFKFALTGLLAYFYTGVTLNNHFWSSQFPLVFSGILPFILLIAYFLNKNIERRERLIDGLFLAAVVFSLSYKLLFTLFNGGNPYPLGCMYRFMFIFDFTMLYLAYKSLKNLDKISAGGITFLSAIYILITLKVYFTPKIDVYPNIILADLFYGIVILLLILLLTKKQKLYTGIIILLMLLHFGDLSANSAICFKLQELCKLSTPEEFRSNYDKMSGIIKELKANDKNFFRVETEETVTKGKRWLDGYFNNNSMLYDYNGISHYSSLGSENLRKFYAKIGFDTYFGNNIIAYSDSLPAFTPSLFGIKYIISDREEHINPYKKLKRVDFLSKPLYVYENPYAFPLGFVSENEIIAKDIFSEKNIFQTYNELMKTITGKDWGDVFDIYALENVEYSDSDRIAHIHTNVETDKKIWLTQKTLWHDAFEYLTFNKQIRRSMYTTVSFVLEYLGQYKTGEPLNIEVYRNKLYRGTSRPEFFYGAENTDILENYLNLIREHALNLQFISSGHLKGTFTTEKNYQVLFLTIPYDENWKITIDGKPVRQVALFDAMTGILIQTTGEHKLEMKYKPKALTEGALISLLALILLCWFIRKYN